MALVKVKTTQVYNLINQIQSEVLGESAVSMEDLRKVVDVGVALENADLMGNFLSGLMLQIGKEILVERPYKSSAPNIYRDQVEYGQIVAKYRGKLDDASENQSWSLRNNTSYDEDIFVESFVDVTLFSEQDAYEIRKSIPQDQYKGSFKSAEAMTNFVGMLFTMVYNSIEVKREALVMRVINNLIATTIYDNNAVRYVKLVTLYNSLFSASLTDATCLYEPKFLKWAGTQIRKYQRLMTRYATIYNIKGADTHTPKEMQHLILHADFIDNYVAFSESDTFHKELISLPLYEETPYWQGTGTGLADTRKIHVTTAGGNEVTNTKVIGVLFDHDACGILEDSPRTNVKYNFAADFSNYWFKQKVRFFNDFNESVIVFTLD